MPDLRQKLSTLLNRYDRDRERNLTEADVSANYIDHLFAALEWDILNPNEYNRQRYVREAGFADVGLLLHGDPRIFVEVKRFGLIPKSTERRGDRTPEEKQAFKYARQAKIKWAILTNFERLHVFDADQERLILAFDDPQEYLPRIEELDRLAKPHIERDSLEHFAQLQAKEDLDRGFLESLKRWRKLLAQDILDRNASNEVILTGSQPRSERGQPDLDKLRRVVQRILDRLVIIRFADDRELLDDFGVVEGMLGGFKTRRSYAAEGQLYRDFLGFCAGMDRKHNTEIFSPKHPSEKITVGNDCLAELFDEITGISFRKFSSDILGNTYESYLGHRLELRDGCVELAERRDLRKGAGIYYTPPYIVRYIVDNTLGRKLAELEAQHGLNAGHEARKLKVLDPACGSGSFLIYAFDVLAMFYERCNERITAENTRLLKDSKPGDQLETQAAVKSLPKRLYDFPKIILEENLYGVDLDEEAAELASVNLIMKAFGYVSSNSRKLPLILNQNIKVGNSLIGYLPGAKLWEKTAIPDKELEDLIALRRRICATDDDTAKRKLLDEAAEQTRQIAAPLNSPLKEFFRDPTAKRPFHWAVEFPEVFARDGSGFDIVVGNPPYLMLQNAANERDTFLFAKTAFQVAQYKIDTYHLFLERAIQALKAGGRQGFITPNTLLKNKFCINLREYLLTNCLLERIVTIPEQVFPDASVDTAIIITKKSRQATHEIEFSKISSAVSELAASIHYDRTRQDKITASNEYQIELVADDPLSRCFTRAFANCEPLGTYAEPYFGIQTFDRKKYVADREADASYRKTLDGTNIERYRILASSEYVCVKPAAVKSGGDAEVYEQDKILVRQIGEFPVAALDTEKHYCLNTIYNITRKAGSYDLRYFLAVVNSKLIQAYWRFRFFDYKATFPKIKKAPLQKIPIRVINFKEREEKRSYDLVVEGAERILRLHAEKTLAERSFAEALNNHPHEWRELGDSYWNHPDFVSLIEKKAVTPNDTGAVTGFRCELDGKTIQISAKVANTWKPVLDMTVADDKLRFFIFYGIRQFLRDNARKKKWGEGRLLELALEKIQVPVFLSHGVHHVEHHLKTLELVLAEMKKHSPLHNLTEMERAIAATDDEIDQLVYKLYGLTPAEIRLVEESTSKPGATKS
ncbi:MAG: TaqI-like C-terminal specificity domain-containing protein [Verrucomicrobiia bacterium]